MNRRPSSPPCEARPLALAVHSGSKSLHGWFYCAGQTEDRVHRFMRYAVPLARIGRRGRARSLFGCQTAPETTATGKPSTSSTRRSSR